MLINANALHIPLADQCVDCVVTSPPYYRLRDYGTARWIGGDEACEHNPQRPDGGERANRSLPLGRGGVYKSVCKKCGAMRLDEQIGLEESVSQFLESMVQVFREVKRVLKNEGTLWMNLGDSYAGSAMTNGNLERQVDKSKRTLSRWGGGNMVVDGLPAKNLIGIPWRVAFALQEDGWILRLDIIWHKTNPMPESVNDRPTKSHEYMFLLTKQGDYFYDNDEIREQSKESVSVEEYAALKAKGTWQSGGLGNYAHGMKRLSGVKSVAHPLGRNKRSVWSIPTQPYEGAHFAAYPEKLVEPCILAGCPKDGIVLDPFVGSGTTVKVAIALGRQGIGLDLKFDYLNELARKRISETQVRMV